MAIDTSKLKVTKLVLELDNDDVRIVGKKAKSVPAQTVIPAPAVTAKTKVNAVTPPPVPVVTVEAKAETVAPVVDKPTTIAPVAPVEDKSTTIAPVKNQEKRDWLRIIGRILFGILCLLLIIALAIFVNERLGLPKNTAEPNPVSAPIDNPALPNNDVWTAVLTSANSNGNFIADLGGHGNGAIIPATATDLQGKTWEIGRVLLTYCEDASTCFYMFGKPGDQLQRAFNVNSYTPQFTGDLEKELQYVDTGWNNNSDVSWTYWNSN